MWHKIYIFFILNFLQPFVSSCVQGPSKSIALIFAVVTAVNIKCQCTGMYFYAVGYMITDVD